MIPLPWRWRTTSTGLLARLERPRSTPDGTNVELAIASLQSMLGNLSSASDAASSKAALIPAVVAGVAALLVDHLVADQLSALAVVAGACAGVGAIVAVIGAMTVLIPLDFKAGPAPESLATQTSDDQLKYRTKLMNTLAEAAAELRDLVNAKGLWLRLALLSSGFSVLSLLLYVALGGIK